MSVYTVHVPSTTTEKSTQNPERFIFIRDGFSFWAFLLGPLWMLWHRLWLIFIGYVGLAILLQIGLQGIGAPQAVMWAAGLLLAFLIGLEAATLRRLTLGRRRWTNVGIVIGDDLEAAERRFFDAWTRPAPRAPIAAPATAPAPGAPAPSTPALSGSTTDIVGLFPQPGGSR
jgi:hypothetical protein